MGSLVSQQIPTWSTIINGGVNRELSPSERAAYDAPYPSEELKAATRVYPQLVPQLDEHMSVEENKGAWRRVFANWQRPLLTLFSDSDPVSKGGEVQWRQVVPGANLPGIPHQMLKGGHFIQEDAGDEIVKIMLDFIRNFPVARQEPTQVTVAKL